MFPPVVSGGVVEILLVHAVVGAKDVDLVFVDSNCRTCFSGSFLPLPVSSKPIKCLTTLFTSNSMHDSILHSSLCGSAQTSLKPLLLQLVHIGWCLGTLDATIPPLGLLRFPLVFLVFPRWSQVLPTSTLNALGWYAPFPPRLSRATKDV